MTRHPKLPLLLIALLAAAGHPAEAAGLDRGWKKQACSLTPRAASHGVRSCGPAGHRLPSVAVWVPGQEQTVTRRVWVPGCSRREWVPPVTVTRFDSCGRPYIVCVRTGHWRTVREPGRYETRVEIEWVPGHWR